PTVPTGRSSWSIGDWGSAISAGSITRLNAESRTRTDTVVTPSGPNVPSQSNDPVELRPIGGDPFAGRIVETTHQTSGDQPPCTVPFRSTVEEEVVTVTFAWTES